MQGVNLIDFLLKRGSYIMARSDHFGGFYHILEWVMWLLYLNILWVLFTIIGLGIFGVFPATVSMFTILRNLLLKQDKPIFKTFFQTYKKEFLKANAVGLITFGVAYILYIDLLFLDRIEGLLFNVFQIGLIVVVIIFLITLFYIFPVYVHFELSFLNRFKHAMLIGIFSPLMNIAMIIGFIALYYLYKVLPGLIPIFGLTLSGLLIMSSVLFAFNRFERRQQKLQGINENKGS